MKDWAGWAIAASRTPDARPRPDGTWAALLTAMPFSGGRAGARPHVRDFRTIRLRQITEDHAIGNLVADVGLLALVLARHLDGRPDRRPVQACGIRRPVTATCCALTGSARSQTTDRTFMY